MIVAHAPLAAMFVGLFAIGAECALRLAYRARGRYFRYTPRKREQLTIDLTALPTMDSVARIFVNEDGERGDPVPRKGENVWRALVVGGSAAECYLLDHDRTWAAVVQRRLNTEASLREIGASRVHVGNISRAIVPCAGIRQMLDLVLPSYERLDALFVMVGASDLVSWLEAKMPPDYDVRPLPLERLFEQHPHGPWALSLRKTAAWRLLGTLHRRLRAPLRRIPNVGAWHHRVRQMRREAKEVVETHSDPTAMLDAFEQNFRGIIRAGQAKGARIVIVRQPWLDRELSVEEEPLLWNSALGRPYKEPVDTFLATREFRALMHAIDSRAAHVALEVGVESVDVKPLLDLSTKMFSDYLHFTPAGAEVVGNAVADVVLRRAPGVTANRQGATLTVAC